MLIIMEEENAFGVDQYNKVELTFILCNTLEHIMK